MIVCGIDFETGADFKAGRDENFVTEIGLELYDTERKQTIESVSLLVNEGKPISPKVAKLTHIDNDMLNKFGYSPEYAVGVLNWYYSRADYMLAHNKAFDQYYCERTLSQFGHPVGKPWLDTMTDIEYPEDCINESLLYLMAYHKILNYNPHRALFDVHGTIQLAALYDWDKMVANSQADNLAVVALVDKDSNQLAKDFKFSWKPFDKTNYPEALRGRWVKEMKSWRAEKFLKELPFVYEIVNLGKHRLQEYDA